MVKTLVEWSKAIRERDKKCLHCGVDQDLHAHHVLPKHSHPDLRLELSNGITLCYRCHKKEHERKRDIRVRSERPRKKTLLKKVLALEAEASQVLELKARVRDLEKTVRTLESRLMAKTPEPIEASIVPGLPPTTTVGNRKRRLTLKEIAWLGTP